jgi:hypothetical protein
LSCVIRDPLVGRGLEIILAEIGGVPTPLVGRGPEIILADSELTLCLREAMALASSTLSWAISERSSWKAVRVSRGMASAGLAGGTSAKQAIHFLGDL